MRVRATFRSYSVSNCMLLAHQCHERGIDPQRIAGFRAWLKLGRCVREGERAQRMWPGCEATAYLRSPAPTTGATQ